MSAFKYEPIDSKNRQIRVLQVLTLEKNSTRAPLTDPVHV
jgi:hypothetical protein